MNGGVTVFNIKSVTFKPMLNRSHYTPSIISPYSMTKAYIYCISIKAWLHWKKSEVLELTHQSTDLRIFCVEN